MTEYEQDTKIVLRAVFTTLTGEAAEISGTPTITIKHRWGNAIETDVNAEDMTQISGTEYYYEWYIPARADKTEYFITYSANYNGTTIIGGEEFQTIPRKAYSRKGGGLVQRLIYKGIWQEEDIKRLFDFLDNLKEEIETIKITSKSHVNTTTKISELMKTLNSMPEIESAIEELKQKLNNFETKDIKDIKGQLVALQENLSEIGEINIKNLSDKNLEELYKQNV